MMFPFVCAMEKEVEGFDQVETQDAGTHGSTGAGIGGMIAQATYEPSGYTFAT